MLEGWAPATFEGLTEWADDLFIRYSAIDTGPEGHRVRRLTLNGTVRVKFTESQPRVVVEWGDARGDFPRGLPLAALTGLIGGLLAVGAGEVHGGE